MNGISIVILIIIAFLIYFAIRSYRKNGGSCSCDGSCGDCIKKCDKNKMV